MNQPENQDTIGAVLSIYPMQDNFVEIILNAVKGVNRHGMAVITDDLGTTVQGPADRVFSYVKEVFLKAAATGGHVAACLILAAG